MIWHLETSWKKKRKASLAVHQHESIMASHRPERQHTRVGFSRPSFPYFSFVRLVTYVQYREKRERTRQNRQDRDSLCGMLAFNAQVATRYARWAGKGTLPDGKANDVISRDSTFPARSRSKGSNSSSSTVLYTIVSSG